MISLRKAHIAPAGTNWVQTNAPTFNKNWRSLCITPTGILFAVVYHSSGQSNSGGKTCHIYNSVNNGETWNNLVFGSNKWATIYATSTGRILVGGDESLYYSDNGTDWHIASDNTSNYYFRSFCTTATGRIIAGSEDGTGIWYSDNNGETWARSSKTTGDCYSLCVTPTGRILAGAGYSLWYSDNNGETWVQSNQVGDTGAGYSLCVTPTGRIIAGSQDRGIWYSDDNGENWTQSNQTDRSFNGSTAWYSLCVTPTGRIIASNNVLSTIGGVYYSDDNGVNWSQATTFNGAVNSVCATSSGRLFASNLTHGIWYSDPDIITAKSAREKYLDQNGVQEIVTQFKAYCDAKVGA